MFGRYQSATARRRASREDKARKARAQASLKDINPGDLVVHTSYGIGKFINISTSPDSGDEEMNILYRDNTILHVPLSQAHLVSRYIGLGSKTPELNKLGDSKWQRAKKSAGTLRGGLRRPAPQRAGGTPDRKGLQPPSGQQMDVGV